MGFKLEVRRDDERLLQSLQANPGVAFPAPYAGYILFFLADADRDEVAWLRDNLALLDELTGRHLAFAIFAQEVSFEIDDRIRQNAEAHLAPGQSLRSHHIGRSIAAKRLVDQGATLKIEGNTLKAMTPGSVIAARAFGVTATLPCILVFDGVPGPEPLLVPLERDLLPKLRSVFQHSIHRFVEGGADEVLELAQWLSDVRRDLRDAEAAKSIAESRAHKALERARVAHAQSKDHRLTEAARRRATRRHDQALADLAELDDGSGKIAPGLATELEELGAAIRSCESEWFTQCVREELRAAKIQGRVQKIGALGLEFFHRLSASVISDILKPPGM